MKTVNFEELYNDRLGRLLHELDQRRKRSISFIFKTGLVLLGIGGLLLIVYESAGMSWWYHFFSLAAIGIVLLFVYTRQKNSYAREFKSKIMPSILQFINSELYYHPYNYMSKDEFNGCGLFKCPDRYNGKDYVEGYVGETHIKFSIVHAEEEHKTTRTDDDGHSQTDTYYATIFCGIFFSADFNKWFSGCTYVMQKSPGLFRKGRVKLEDPRFNDRFTVYSSDQIEARYILAPNLMERIVALSDKAGKISLSFVGSRVYIAIPTNYNLFEPPFLSSIQDADVIYNYFYFLNLVVGIVEDLNLNTRIWSK
ncbi:DUF3137 domain-containing protein [Dissulfurispira sp.]|uniref:DUF3137 domain-containing protein n=1 Tax=Dissulfurispira sp. TaxID=2817609 RepID=UPI002FDA07B6